MAVIITSMPSTGEAVKISHSPFPVEEVRARWADTDCVTVESDEEFARRPNCPTCGQKKIFRACADCR